MKAASSLQLKGKDEQKTARLVPGSVATVGRQVGGEELPGEVGSAMGKSREA